MQFWQKELESLKFFLEHSTFSYKQFILLTSIHGSLRILSHSFRSDLHAHSQQTYPGERRFSRRHSVFEGINA